MKKPASFFTVGISMGMSTNALGKWMLPPHLQTKFFTSESNQGVSEETSSPIDKDYRKGMREIGTLFIRDWYVTQLVLNSKDSNEATQAVVDDYLPKFSIAAYKEVVLQTMEKRKRVPQRWTIPPLRQ